MNLADVLVMEVRDATTHAVVAVGCLPREPGKVEEALEATRQRFERHRERAGMAVTIRLGQG
jgi:hypothetical protein